MNLCSFIGHKWLSFNSFYMIEYLELALGEELANLNTGSVLLLIEQLTQHINQQDIIMPRDNYSFAVNEDIPKTKLIAPHFDYIVKYTQQHLDPLLREQATIEDKAKDAYYGKEHFLESNRDYKAILKNLKAATEAVLPMFTKIKVSVCSRCNTTHDPRLALKPILAKIYQNLKLEKINIKSGFFAL